MTKKFFKGLKWMIISLITFVVVVICLFLMTAVAAISVDVESFTTQTSLIVWEESFTQVCLEHPSASKRQLVELTKVVYQKRMIDKGLVDLADKPISINEFPYNLDSRWRGWKKSH